MDAQPAVKKLFSTRVVALVLAVIAFIAVGAGVYFYNQYSSLSNILKNPNVAVEKQTKELVAQVGKLMILPTDEQPTIATVTDASKLKSQEFFANAVNGDKVLIYVKARKAILYDPAKNVIVDVAPVNIAQNQSEEPSPTAVKVTPSSTPVPTK